MFEIITIQMHKLVKLPDSEPTALKSPKQLCSAQCFLSSAETIWRSNHELALLCLSRYSKQNTSKWSRALSSNMDAALVVFCLEYLDKQSSANSWFERHIVSAELRKHCALHSCLGDFKAVGSLYRVSIFPSVNATRTSWTGLERDRNRNRSEQGLS